MRDIKECKLVKPTTVEHSNFPSYLFLLQYDLILLLRTLLISYKNNIILLLCKRWNLMLCLCVMLEVIASNYKCHTFVCGSISIMLGLHLILMIDIGSIVPIQENNNPVKRCFPWQQLITIAQHNNLHHTVISSLSHPTIDKKRHIMG